MERRGYLYIKEAAVQYDVSRSKLYRMIQAGKVRTATDPRDRRATLLHVEDLEEYFRFAPDEAENAMGYTADRYTIETEGTLTAIWRARIDKLRARAAMSGRLGGDSVDIIREAREARDDQLDSSISGEGRGG